MTKIAICCRVRLTLVVSIFVGITNSAAAFSEFNFFSPNDQLETKYVNPGVVLNLTSGVNSTIKFLSVYYFNTANCGTGQKNFGPVTTLTFLAQTNVPFTANKFSLGGAGVTLYSPITNILSLAIRLQSVTGNSPGSGQQSTFTGDCGTLAVNAGFSTNYCCVNVVCNATGGNNCVETGTPTNNFTLND